MAISEKTDKQLLLSSMKFPLFLVVILWIIKIYEIIFNLDLHTFGIFPQKLSSLHGIITSPLVHSGMKHLVSNTGPLFILCAGVFYFYRKIAFKIFTLTYLITGLLVWIAAREAYHIGASGLIYGFAAFLFTSGILRKDIRLSAVSLVVVFLYGGMIWGILPLKPHVSWESHLLGLVVGVVLAIFYRKQPAYTTVPDWNDEEIMDSTEEDINFKYYYSEEDEEENSSSNI
jgi:membrane associated rhomboid family serine protease